MTEPIYLGLADLLEQDLSSYEYFHSLSSDVRRALEEEDVRSFAQMQDTVRRHREKN